MLQSMMMWLGVVANCKAVGGLGGVRRSSGLNEEGRRRGVGLVREEGALACM